MKFIKLHVKGIGNYFTDPLQEKKFYEALEHNFEPPQVEKVQKEIKVPLYIEQEDITSLVPVMLTDNTSLGTIVNVKTSVFFPSITESGIDMEETAAVTVVETVEQILTLIKNND